MSTAVNFDPVELTHFDQPALDWWDLQGSMRLLHAINPIRLQYLMDTRSLQQARVLDIGCGGGILSEAMARHGAQVTGLDLSGHALYQARAHLPENLSVNYIQQDARGFAEEHSGVFDLVVCMELLEHVPDVPALLSDCARALRPGGHLVIATINRTAMAFALLILGAEYLLQLLEIGTHRYDRFIRPSELARSARQAGLTVQHIQGMTYNPLTRQTNFCASIQANYLMRLQRL